MSSRPDIDQYFVPENEVPPKEEHASPSGKYRIEIARFSTGPHTWTYSRGIIYKGNEEIARIHRNYGGFYHSFIENHPSGHDFFIGGEDYQGQTVIDLTTGERKDTLSEGSEKGHGFCWAGYTLDTASKILIVEGCYWACPYEFRFFDFSDPLNFKEIEADDCIYTDVKTPEISPDIVKTFQSRDEDSDPGAGTVDAIKTFFLQDCPDGKRLVFSEEWVSDYEKDRRQKIEESDKKFREWLVTFKSYDPLYLAHERLLSQYGLTPEEHSGIGVTYDGWCPDFKGEERRFSRRIVVQKSGEYPVIDLEWAVATGPIKLVIYTDGRTSRNIFFEHSIEGMEKAFALAVKAITDKESGWDTWMVALGLKS